MKKIILLCLIIAALGSTSCRKLALHGDFSGQWQILTIDYPDGTHVEPQGEYYYCFYRDVAQLTDLNNTRIVANMTYTDDEFVLQFPYEIVERLAPWGIICPDTVDPETKGYSATFTIDRLTSKRLVMTTDMGVTIACRKY